MREYKRACKWAYKRGCGRTLRAAPKAIRRWLLALPIALGLMGCAGEPVAGPSYKPKAPPASAPAPATQLAPLSGLVYVADSPAIAAETSLPEGYQLFSGKDGRVTVRIPGTPGETRVVPIVDGAYQMPDLPLGVDLEVSASAPGFTGRRQQVRIVLAAGRKLNFAYEPDGSGFYLQPFQDVAP